MHKRGAVIGSAFSTFVSAAFSVLGSADLRKKKKKKAATDLGRKVCISLIPTLDNAGVTEVKEFDPGTVSAVSTREGEGVEAPLSQEHRPWWRRMFGV